MDDTIDDQFPSQPELNAQLPQFRLIRKLSETRMSVIYLAEERHLGNRPVAVKVIAPMLAHEQSFRERFRREMLSAANLSHPNIVPVFSAPSDDELLYLVMPYIDGPNLSALLKQHGPLDLAWTVQVIGEVANALDFAHASGVVHRDVKPGNILIENRSGRVLLCDFGIAAPALGERLTEVGRRVGTPGYLAPELIPASPDGTAPVDPRADVYSLGVVLFQCLTGRAPHQHSDTDALLWAQGHEEVPQVTMLRPGLPVGLNRVLRTALAKRPEDRYATCRELADDFALAASGGKVRGAPRRTKAKPSRRRTRWLQVGTVAAAAAVAATVIVVVNNQSGEDGADSPLRRLPPPLRGDCSSTTPSDSVPGAEETLVCNDGTWEVTASLFADRPTMDTAYARAIRDSGIARATGDCTVATDAEHRYPNGGQQVGRMLCYTAQNVTSLVWTDDRQRTIIEADAREADDAEIREAWASWVGIPRFPTNDEKALVNLVEGEIMEPGFCKRAPAGTLDTFRNLTAAIECDPVLDGVTSVSYYRFGDINGLRTTHGQHVDAVKAPGGVDCTSSDPPPSGFLGNRRWDQRSVDMGEMLCYLGERSEPVFQWTVEPLLVMARATGTDPAEVAGWWQQTLGMPVDKVVQGVNKKAKFPNAEEAELLQHVPEASEKNCMRPSPGQIKKNVGNANVVAVVCGPSSGASVVFYYQFASADTMNSAYNIGQTVSGGDCTQGPPNFAADAPYQRGGDTGRLSCRSIDNVPQLSWTSDKNLILGFGFQGYSQQELIQWWQNEAGPV